MKRYTLLLSSAEHTKKWMCGIKMHYHLNSRCNPVFWFVVEPMYIEKGLTFIHLN